MIEKNYEFPDAAETEEKALAAVYAGRPDIADNLLRNDSLGRLLTEAFLENQMKYLYVDLVDDISAQTDNPPTEKEVEAVIHNELLVFRVNNNGDFEILEPIDSTDQDSWGLVDK